MSRFALVALVFTAGCATAVDGAGSPAPDAVELIREHGCTRCHSTTGADGIGPTWRGLAGSTERLSDGSTIVVDDEYLRRAITDPDADLVAGYELVEMPTFELDDAEVDALVDYVARLG